MAMLEAIRNHVSGGRSRRDKIIEDLTKRWKSGRLVDIYEYLPAR